MRVVSVEFGGLDQAHDDGGALTGAQGACEQPVRTAECHGADTVFDVVVVYRQIAILEVSCQSGPAARAVVDGFRRRRAIGHLAPLSREPMSEGPGDGS